MDKTLIIIHMVRTLTTHSVREEVARITNLRKELEVADLKIDIVMVVEEEVIVEVKVTTTST